MNNSRSVRQLGIVLFDDVEVLDFCGPFEVFSVTEIGGIKPFQVVTIAEEPVVTATNGLRVVTDFRLEEAPALDILLLPGGQGTRREIHNETLIAWVAERCAATPLVLTVCTEVSHGAEP